MTAVIDDGLSIDGCVKSRLSVHRIPLLVLFCLVLTCPVAGGSSDGLLRAVEVLTIVRVCLIVGVRGRCHVTTFREHFLIFDPAMGRLVTDSGCSDDHRSVRR